MEKEENTVYNHLLPLPKMSAKDSVLRDVKSQDCVARVNPFQNKPWFLRVCSTSLLKTLWEKEKLLMMSNFSFSHSVFYPFGELAAIFTKFKPCWLQTLSIWKSLKFVVWERVKTCSMTVTIIESMPFIITSEFSKTYVR